jgi:ribokinase
VSSRWAMRDGRAPTGASVLVSSHDRNAAIFTFRGANTLLAEADLRKEAFAADLVYISSLSNESADAFPAIVEHAKAQGALVATNPRVRQLSSRGGAFLDSLAQIDILAVNRTEADVLVPGLVGRFGEGGKALTLKPGEQLPRLAVRGFAGGGHEMSLVGLFAALRRLGPRFVVVTDGRYGAFVGSQEAIAAFVAMGRPAEDALRAAAINAGSVVGHVDTQTGLLAREEIDRRLAEAKSTLEVRIWSH